MEVKVINISCMSNLTKEERKLVKEFNQLAEQKKIKFHNFQPVTNKDVAKFMKILKENILKGENY